MSPPPPPPALQGPQSSSSSSSWRQIHSVRFFRPLPSPVHCMAFAGDGVALLALSRADSSVEIWNFRGKAPFLERQTVGLSESSVEALCWARGRRLFAATTQGLVLELDVDRTLTAKRQFAVTAGAAWCMAYNKKKNRLAVGTEEGYVCLVEVTDDGMEYDRVLDKQEGRILCLAWHSSGDHIVTGSSDTVRVWDVSSGHPTARMTTGRSERGRETVVWSVAITDDLIVLSGDSRGKTCFWSADTGTLVDAYQTHAADVLAVCLGTDQDVAYSAGVDPNIFHFQPVVRKDGRSKWMKSVHRAVHSHDVRALVAGTLLREDHGGEGAKRRPVLFSAGVDSRLAVNDVGNKTVAFHPPIPYGQCISPAVDAGLLLLRYQTHLEVWSLGKASEQEKNPPPGTILGLQEDACKLLELRTKDGETLRTCCISRDGHFVAYVTASRLRVYRLSLRERAQAPALKRLHLRSSPGAVKPVHHVGFFQGQLISVTEEGGIQFFDLEDGDGKEGEEEFRLAKSVGGADLGLGAGISLMALDSDLGVAALADFFGAVVTVDLAGRRLAARMPAYDPAPLTCMSVDASNKTLLLVYADQSIRECSLKTGHYTKFSTNLRLPKFFRSRRMPARGVFRMDAGDGRQQRLVVYDDSSISVIREAAEAALTSPSSFKSRRRKGGGGGSRDEDSKQEASVSVLRKKYEHLVYLGPLSDGSLILVEVRPRAFEEQLPPSLKQKKYGAM